MNQDALIAAYAQAMKDRARSAEMSPGALGQQIAAASSGGGSVGGGGDTGGPAALAAIIINSLTHKATERLDPQGALAMLSSVLGGEGNYSTPFGGGGPGTALGAAELGQQNALAPLKQAQMQLLQTQMQGGALDNQAKALANQKAAGGFRMTQDPIAAMHADQDARQQRILAYQRAQADLQSAMAQPGRDREQYAMQVQQKKQDLAMQHASLDNMLKEFELKKKTAELQNKLEQQHMRLLEAEAARKSAWNDRAMGMASQLMSALLGG